MSQATNSILLSGSQQVKIPFCGHILQIAAVKHLYVLNKSIFKGYVVFTYTHISDFSLRMLDAFRHLRTMLGIMCHMNVSIWELKCGITLYTWCSPKKKEWIFWECYFSNLSLMGNKNYLNDPWNFW